MNEKTLLFAVANEDSDTRFIVEDGMLIETDLKFDLFDGPALEPKWELGEVELSRNINDMDLGDCCTITKAQDNPLLSGLGLEEGTVLKCVLAVSTF